VLKEDATQEKIDYCKDTFGTRTAEYRFCNRAQAYIKSNKKYQSDFRELLEIYVDKVSLETIGMEKLIQGNKILQDGIKEIKEFEGKVKDFCHNLKIEDIISGLIDDSHVYYKRPDGSYSVFNRIDTNYSALAVAITWYYHSKQAFDMLMNDMGNKLNKIDWNAIVVSWIDHFFDPELEPMDPRTESYQLDSPLFYRDPSPALGLFKLLFNPDNIKVDEKKVFNSILKILKSVRERGNQSEDLFEKLLQKYNIEYFRYAKDYGFVDRFLGVDFIVKKGEEWLPVQVKTSKNEPQYRIEELDCDEPIIAIRDGDDFRLNNSRGFERFFCITLQACKRD
jgi:hypothetical protein